MIRTVEWRSGRVVMIDQRLLPTREVYRVYRDARDVAAAIRDMVVRGAPAIGVAAAMGIALGARKLTARNLDEGFAQLCRMFAAARPTAVNLFWAIERMRAVFAAERSNGLAALRQRLEDEAKAIHAEDIAANRRLGRFGAALLPESGSILTYCNAGALATAGYGTALGVVRAAREAGKPISVYACETRPFLQGARLTAWELRRDRIPVTLVTDNAAGALLQRGLVAAVVVGTDRTAANGDVANKIGTYVLAVLAARHNVPFYVAAPCSSIDLLCPSGDEIPIEERSGDEITRIGGVSIAPRGISVLHPAFDVTPARLVTAIVTDRGVAQAPYRRSLAKLLGASRRPSLRTSAAPRR